ncbi:hypothetical protein COLO4_08680 [Corchorus olitorius]|uniref:Uncharacterized protein n=1 Tax=Corchorus olitorius TaxID=93759 RepID=A0A1R3KEV8_9ROSI|nr:hypothetical protein COLO4_08680 [Corchorus olitorius]
MGFHLILLLWLLQTAASQEANEIGCEEICGNVTIPSPFGIEPGCHLNSWFRVTCIETVDGRKPFISSIGLELLGSYTDAAVMVNTSVTYHNCSDKVNKGNAAYNQDAEIR